MKALLLDAGNSRIKWGVLHRGQIRRTGHVAQKRIREGGLQVLTTRLPRRVDKVLVSNVAGAGFAARLSGVLSAHCGCEVRFVHTERRGWGVTNGYSQPRRMGVDRWVALVGAWTELHSACLVVDAGTALTIDAIDNDGMHLGGQIIAGVTAMADALASSTSELPRVRPAAQGQGAGMQMFARNTSGAIREGAQNAIAGAVDRAVRGLRSGGYEPTVVLTGGDASRILSALDGAPLHRPHLVLQGLKAMLESAK